MIELHIVDGGCELVQTSAGELLVLERFPGETHHQVHGDPEGARDGRVLKHTNGAMWWCQGCSLERSGNPDNSLARVINFAPYDDPAAQR